jgi:hypothetical protein
MLNTYLVVIWLNLEHQVYFTTVSTVLKYHEKRFKDLVLSNTTQSKLYKSVYRKKRHLKRIETLIGEKKTCSVPKQLES